MVNSDVYPSYYPIMHSLNLSKVTALYKNLKETTVIGISLTYQERLRNTPGVNPVTLILGWNLYKINKTENWMKKESNSFLFYNIKTL